MSQPTPTKTPSKTSPKTPLNWEEAKARLARAAQSVADAEQLSGEHARAILDERARKLARTPPRQPDASEVLQLVTFQLGGERFAIEALFVREMIHLEHVTPVPDAPDFLLGTANLRGEVVAVIDVRGFFGSALEGMPSKATTLVLGEQRVEFALLVDLVEEVSTFRTTDFFDATAAISAPGREWVRGIAPSGVILLDARILLNDPRLFVDAA